jgi:hypothetical protein
VRAHAPTPPFASYRRRLPARLHAHRPPRAPASRAICLCAHPLAPLRSRWSFCAWCYVKSSKRAWDCCEIGPPQTACDLDPKAPSKWPTDAQGLARLAALRLADEGAAAGASPTASSSWRHQTMSAASLVACCALLALAVRRRARAVRRAA